MNSFSTSLLNHKHISKTNILFNILPINVFCLHVVFKVLVGYAPLFCFSFRLYTSNYKFAIVVQLVIHLLFLNIVSGF